MSLTINRLYKAILLVPVFFSLGVNGQAITEQEIIELSQGAFAKFPLLGPTMVIHDNHVLYDPARNTLAVGIEFKQVHDVLLGEALEIHINGNDLSALDPITSSSIFIPSNDPADPYGQAGAFLEYPLNATKQYPLANITAELIHYDTGIVIARQKVVVIETTQDNITRFDGLPDANDGLNYQVTGYGIGGDGIGNPTGLEYNIAETFPMPSHDYFSEQVDAAVRAIPPTTRTDLESCIGLNKLDDNRFSNIFEFPAYAEAFAIATATYAGFQGCRASGFAAAVCNRSCVKKPPMPKHFKLCVNQMEGVPVSGKIGDSHDIELSAQDSHSLSQGLLKADVELHDFQGDVDIHLQDMSIEWGRDNRCIGRPRAKITPTQIEQRDWLSEFAVCRANIQASRAVTTARQGTSPTYSVQALPNDPSHIKVDDATLAELKLRRPQENADVDACAETFLNGTASDIVQHFTPRMEGALNDAFNANSPNTMLAQTIEQAIQPIELSAVVSEGIEMSHVFDQISSSPTTGLNIQYASTFTPLLTQSRGVPVSRYVTQMASQYREVVDSTDPYGNTISTNHAFTTTWLNHFMHAKGRSFILNQTFTFSAKQLGSLDYGEQTQTFDGLVLSELHSGLAYLKGQTLEIGLYRNMNPFFYQIDDPNPQDLIPLVGIANSFIMEGIRVVVKAPNETLPNGDIIIGETFIEMSLGLFEEEFDLSHDKTLGTNYLNAPVIEELVSKMTLDIIKFESPTCGKIKHELGTFQFGACENVIERAFKAFLHDHLVTLLADLLNDIPAVQHFYSESEDRSVEQQLLHASRNQLNSRVNVSGILPH